MTSKALRPLLAPLLITVLAAATAARAEDRAPGAEEGSLTWKGITLYGVVDIGLQYQTHGAPGSDFVAYTTEPVIQKNSNRSITALTSSPMGWSRIGVSGAEPLAAGWAAVFRLESYFNPTSGQLSDGLKSLTLNNGRAPTGQTSNLDSSVAGQLFGGAAYAGLSLPRFGTLTFGRQLTLLADGIVKYDAIEDGENSGHAFSLLGGSRTAAGGGTTEDTRLDRSLKYNAKFGWLHLGALYQLSGASGSANAAAQVQAGASFSGVSADGFYAKKYDAISATAMSPAQLAALPPAYSPSNSVASTVSDNSVWALMGRYELGAVRLFAGYERIDFANPRTPLAPGFESIGGYLLAYVNNAAYPNDRVLRVFWGGAKWHVTPDFYLAGSYYGYRQNSYATGSYAGCSTSANSGCSGTANAVGVVADQSLGRHFDAYLGTLWTEVQDGLANAFLNKSTVTTTLGCRLKF
jgi:predicted porin